MKPLRPDLYGYFPMQAALGLYNIHKSLPCDEEEEEKMMELSEAPPPRRKEESTECILKKTASATTKDTKH